MKYGYYIFNTFIVLLLILAVSFGVASRDYGVILQAGERLELFSNTDEEILEKYKDNKAFKEMQKNVNSNLEDARERLAKVEIDSSNYNNIQREIHYYEQYGLEMSLYAALHDKSDSIVKRDCLVYSGLILIIYIIGMIIYLVIKKKLKK